MSARARYFAGIDAGGSKVLAVVVDARGRERGRGQAGSANHQSVGLDQAAEHVREALDAAVQGVGMPLPLAGVWIGMAGVDRARDRDAWLPRLQPLAESIRLTNDAELLLSALEGGIGVAVIAGTGSIALGRDLGGDTARAGGWGHILGDEGSGYDIARLGLQAAARAADGRGPETTLLTGMLQRWNLGQPSDLIGRIYPARDKASLACLAKVVFDAARGGDQIARRILTHAASELALAALAAGNALDFAGRPLPLALGGGLLVNEPRFRAQVLRRIRSKRPLGQVAVVKDAALSAARAAATLITPAVDR